MPTPIRISVLLSGSGTTLQNLIDHVAQGKLDAEIVLVVSNRADAYGLQRAARAGIPTGVVERKACKSREEFSGRIFDLSRQAKADLVCMGGFLQLIQIPEDFTNRVMNIHPALIPAFCGKGFHGLHVHEAVLNAGVKLTGCTVHFADNEYDHGPIILQRAVPVYFDDTPEGLLQRVFEQECQAYPEAITLFARDRLEVIGRRVRIR
jgi:phosphoribosylglycinamide formyltransferase-1